MLAKDVAAVRGHPLEDIFVPEPSPRQTPQVFQPRGFACHVVVGPGKTILAEAFFQEVAHARPGADLVIHGGRKNEIAFQF